MNGARLHDDRRGLSIRLFIAGVVAGLIQWMWIPPLPPGLGFETFAEAKNLAEHGAFANPFYVANTGYTAVNPPLYPLVLALLMKLPATPAFVTVAAVAGNIVASAIVAAWLPRIAVVLFGDSIPGVVAAVIWLVSVQLMPAWDSSYTVAGLVLFCVYSASSIGRAGGAVRFGALAGGAVGFLALLNTSSLLVSLPWVAYLIVKREVSFQRAARYGSVLLVVALLIVSAWVLRNYYRLGAPVLRTNLGMTLYASNNDCAEPSLVETEGRGCYQSHHPNMSMSEAELVRTLGEVAYDRRRTADAWSWAMENPGPFRRLTAARVRGFWFPPPDHPAYTAYVIWFATLLSVPGMILMLRNREPALVFMMTVLLVYPPMYYVVVTDVRYRYPVLWLTFLFAGYFIRKAMGAWPKTTLRAALDRGRVRPRSEA